MALISRKLLRARPQELGKIKIGGSGRKIPRKDKDGKDVSFRVPVKYDHFVVTTRYRSDERAGDNENFVKDAAIHAHPAVGQKPTELDAVLMFDRPDENFHAEMLQFKGRGKDGKIWQCDGETALNLRDKKSGPCVRLAGKECKCKPYGRLHLQLLASPYTLGFHVFRTTSWESTNNIQSALEEIFDTFGTCYHAPVKLVLYPSEDKHESGTSTSYKVGLVLAMPMVDVAHRINEARQYARLAGSEMRALAAGVRSDLDATDAVGIDEDLFPEVVDVHAIETATALHATDTQQPSADATLVAGVWTEPTDDRPALDHEPTDDEVERLNEDPVDDRDWSEIAGDQAAPPAAEFVDSVPVDFAGADQSAAALHATATQHATKPATEYTREEFERDQKGDPPGEYEKERADLRADYEESLARAGLDARDRFAFENRLGREKIVGFRSVDDWSPADLRRAIAEVQKIIAESGPEDGPANTAEPADLFNN